MKRSAIALIVVGILVIWGAALLLLPYFRTPQGTMSQIPVGSSTAAVASTAATSTAVAPALATSTPLTPEIGPGERSYANSTFHFSLSYPDTLQAEEYKETGGALTVTFQNADNSQAFEIYVTPYSGTQVSAARFKTDEPSGTFLQPTDVIIAGTKATIFYGYNPIMGDTREVWFIKGGFLYEVATYKSLDSWIAGIMQTWKFI